MTDKVYYITTQHAICSATKH